MPGSELDRAKALLARPDLEQADRDALLAEFPELEPPKAQLAEASPSEPTTEELMVGITDQGPPAIMSQEPAPLGSAVGIQPSEIPQQPQPTMDMSEQALMAEQSLIALDDADISDDAQNATKRLSMEPRASVNAETFDNMNAYYHFEPTVEEVQRWAAQTGNEEAFNALEEDGEESDIYKKYADIQWKKVRAEFERTGEAAVRLKYIDPQTASQWFDATMGNLGGRVTSFLGGFDDTLSFGVGKQALAYAGGKMMPKAEQALVQAGVIKPFADRLEAQKSRYPVEAVAGSIYGYAKNPMSAAKAVTKGVAKTAPKLAAPFIDAALTGVGIETVSKLGAEARGEEAATAGDIARSGVASGLFGGLMGHGAELLGKAGLAKMKSLRQDPAIAEMLDRVGMGQPGQRGGTTMKPGTGGVRPHKQYARKAEDIATEKAAARQAGKPEPSPRSPATEMAGDIEWQMRQELDNYRNKVKDDISQSKKAYFKSTDNDPNARVSLETTGKKIMKIIEEGSPGGWDLPGFKKSMLEDLLNSMRHLVARPGPPEVDPAKVSKITEGRRFGSIWPEMVTPKGKPDKFARHAILGDIQAGAIRQRNMTPVYQWRRVSPREFDSITKNISDLLNDARNKSEVKALPRNLEEIQAVLNEARDKFPANAYTPGEEVVRTSSGPKTVRGFSALNAKHHRMLNDVRNAEEAMNLKGVKRLEPNIDAQKIAVMKRIKEWGLANKSVSDDTLRKLFRGRPDLVEVLDAVASGEAYEAYQRGIAAPAGVTTGQGKPRIWMTTGLGRLTGTYLDPAMTLLSRLEGKGGDVAALAGMREEELDVIPAAERALLGIKDVTSKTTEGVSTLYKLYQQYVSRGLRDELEQNKEKAQ